MSNFEQIDDFLTNRLSEQEKVAFEQQMKSDPALKADVELQKQILEGVKKARIAELKAMLNNVPVSGNFSSGISGVKIAALLGTAAVVGTSLYFYLKPEEVKQEATATQRQVTKPVELNRETAELTIPEEKKEVISPVEPEKEVRRQAKKKESVTPSATRQPQIEVIDPSDELVDNSGTEIVKAEKQNSSISNSHIEVELDSSDKKHSFHYQFLKGKLLLYGAFDKGLYEILEINGDKKSVFLFYKENYYLLDEKQHRIIALEPIKDGVLLKKLKEYRAQ